MMLGSLPNPDALRKSSGKNRGGQHSALTSLGTSNVADLLSSRNKKDDYNKDEHDNDDDDQHDNNTGEEISDQQQHNPGRTSPISGLLSDDILDPLNVWNSQEKDDISDNRSGSKKKKHKKKRKDGKKEKKKKRNRSRTSSIDVSHSHTTSDSRLSEEHAESDPTRYTGDSFVLEGEKPSEGVGPERKQEEEEEEPYYSEDYEPDYEEPVDDGEMDWREQYPQQQQQQKQQQHFNHSDQHEPDTKKHQYSDISQISKSHQTQNYHSLPSQNHLNRIGQSYPPPESPSNSQPPFQGTGGPDIGTPAISKDEMIESIAQYIQGAITREIKPLQEEIQEQRQSLASMTSNTSREFSNSIRALLENEREHTQSILETFEKDMTNSIQRSVRDSLASERGRLHSFTSELESTIVRELRRAVDEQESLRNKQQEEFFSSERSRLESLYSNMETAIQSLQTGESDYKSKMNELFEEMKRFDEERERFYEEQEQHSKQVREDQREIHRQRSELQAKKEAFAKEQSSKQHNMQSKEASVDQLQARIDQDYGVIKEKKEMVEKRESELERARKNLQEEQESFRNMSQELTQTALKVQRESEMASEAFQKAAQEKSESQRLKEEAEQMKKETEHEKNSILNESKKLQSQRNSLEKERLELAQERKQLAMERSYHNQAAEKIRTMENKLNQQAQNFENQGQLLDVNSLNNEPQKKKQIDDNEGKIGTDDVHPGFARELERWERERRLGAQAAQEQSHFLHQLGEDMLMEMKDRHNTMGPNNVPPWSNWGRESDKKPFHVDPSATHPKHEPQQHLINDQGDNSIPRRTGDMANYSTVGYRPSTTTTNATTIAASAPTWEQHPSTIPSARTHNNTFSFTSLYPLSSTNSQIETTRGSSIPIHSGRHYLVNHHHNTHSAVNNNNNTNRNLNYNNNTGTPASAETYHPHTSPTSTVSSSENQHDFDRESNTDSGSRDTASTRSNEIESESTE